MAVNPLRGYTPKPIPHAFWWEGPSGSKVLAWNGFHYLWGRSIAKLGDWRFVDDSLPPIVAGLEADPDYPFDFMYAQSTHPIRVDNGPPDPRMPTFVQRVERPGPHAADRVHDSRGLQPDAARPLRPALPDARAATGSTGGRTASPPAPTRPGSAARPTSNS